MRAGGWGEAPKPPAALILGCFFCFYGVETWTSPSTDPEVLNHHNNDFGCRNKRNTVELNYEPKTQHTKWSIFYMASKVLVLKARNGVCVQYFIVDDIECKECIFVKWWRDEYGGINKTASHVWKGCQMKISMWQINWKEKKTSSRSIGLSFESNYQHLDFPLGKKS